MCVCMRVGALSVRACARSKGTHARVCVCVLGCAHVRAHVCDHHHALLRAYVQMSEQ